MSPRTLRSGGVASLGVRGFTLVELMVALSGGLFLSAVVFALSRDTTRFYQQETRVASATLAGLVGFERLKSDIQRAGYLSTPNIQTDPRILVRQKFAVMSIEF
jgi:Tfp pilus assembly protein PilW